MRESHIGYALYYHDNEKIGCTDTSIHKGENMPPDMRKINFSDADTMLALGKSALNFVPQRGTKVAERTLPYWEWSESRRRLGVWPFRGRSK